MRNTIAFKQGKYITELLWEEGEVNFPYNRQLAVKRLESLERKLEKDPELKNKYHSTINQYIEQNHATNISSDNPMPITSYTNYITHHAVIHRYKPEKVDAVYNVAANYKDRSLNENLLKGPNLLNDLVSLLTCFCFIQMANITR